MTFDNLKLIHLISVNLFLLIYLIKTPLLLFNADQALAKITKSTKVLEMIISVVFLASGVWLIVLQEMLETMMIVKLGLVIISIPLAIIGFKKRKKVLAILAFLMLISTYGIAEMLKFHKPVGTPTGQTVSAAELFKHNCQRCHGAKGNLSSSGAADLTLSTLDGGALKTILQNGRNKMPSFSALSDEERDALATYIQTLRIH